MFDPSPAGLAARIVAEELTQYVQAALAQHIRTVKGRWNSREWVTLQAELTREVHAALYRVAVIAADSVLAAYRAGAELAQPSGTSDPAGVPDPSEATLQRLHKSITPHLNQLPTAVIRQARAALHHAMQPVIGQAVDGHRTWQEAAEEAERRLRERGVSVFADKAGRRWRLTTYTEMAVRTGVMNAHHAGFIDAYTAIGGDLVTVTRHNGTCDLCAPWEGRTLTLGKHTPGPLVVSDPATGEITTIEVDATLDSAREQGLFHPNCRHALVASLLQPLTL